MSEIRDIPGYPLYQVSDDGCIFFKKTGRQRKLKLDRYGYLVAYIRAEDGKKHTLSANKAVCLAFYGPPPIVGMHAAHSNNIRSDNRKENLSWKTPKENQADRIAAGTANRRERNGRAKLTELQVSEIRASSFLSRSNLAEKYGVSTGTIGAILADRRWRQ